MALINIEGIFERIGFRHSGSLGVAFSGGGARGFSHIGIMMALDEFGIRPTVLAGVSAGSIAAVLYGAGLSPREMAECFKESSKFNNFRDWSVPKDGIFRLNKFAKLLESWLPVKNLEELRIPTVVCATNMNRGTQVAWGKGEIVPRVVASCSIPIVFKPVLINGDHYVDGGVLHNLPAWAIRDYCKTLIGCNCSPLDRSYRYKSSILDIAMRTFSLAMKANVLQDIRLCDYLITPRDVQHTKTFDLSSIDKCIMQGYDSACQLLSTLDLSKFTGNQ